MAFVAATLNFDNFRIEIDELIGGEIEGLGCSIDGDRDFILIGQSRQDGDFSFRDSAIFHQILPGRQIGSDFPLAICCRAYCNPWILRLAVQGQFQVAGIFGIDGAIFVIVNESFVPTNDKVLGVPAI